MKQKIKLIAAALLAVLSVLLFSNPPEEEIPTSASQGIPVIRVVDGDTIKVLFNGRNETVRLIGIDTPETVDPRRPVECFGKQASAFLTDLLAGESVKLKSDPTQGDRDKYDRLLRYVYTSSDKFVNETLIRQGYAHEYTYDEPYRYQEVFKAAERKARESERGLWNSEVCSEG